ncbi:hypothetical protein [Micromonospora chersina]|uniref:hypothetical protein n=1 Tax=Micromonospora chersina TaxID=47854 RepID=UPI0033CAD322
MKSFRFTVLIGMLLALLLGAGVMLLRRDPGTAPSPARLTAEREAQPVRADPRLRLGPNGEQAGSGLSRVEAPDPRDLVRLREAPHGDNHGQTQGFGIIDELPAGTAVLMKCYEDGQAPRDGNSRRWFWVVEAPAGSPHPGVAGYVWSDLVWDPIRVPRCDASTTKPTSPLRNSAVSLTRGAPARAGYYYSVRLAKFPPGWHATVYCMDASDEFAFHSFELVVGADGTAGRDNGCYSGVPGAHRVSVWDIESASVTWSTSAPPRATGAPSLPADARAQQPGRSATPDMPEPAPTPVTRVVTVRNLVTNGANAMREDKPAYLSTRTEPLCRPRGCALPGTEMSSGDHVVATCQVRGTTITNGQNDSSVDDGNPGLFSSDLWYGIQWSDGRTGFLSEVWIQHDDRGGLDLPSC